MLFFVFCLWDGTAEVTVLVYAVNEIAHVETRGFWMNWEILHPRFSLCLLFSHNTPPCLQEVFLFPELGLAILGVSED
jgi:hypothetical protein